MENKERSFLSDTRNAYIQQPSGGYVQYLRTPNGWISVGQTTSPVFGIDFIHGSMEFIPIANEWRVYFGSPNAARSNFVGAFQNPDDLRVLEALDNFQIP